MPFAAVNGLKMYYEIHGDGPPLLLLHGGTGSIPVTRIPYFEPRFRVIAMERTESAGDHPQSRGGQSALFAERLRDAADLGCRLAFTETGEDSPDDPNPSYHNMIRAGFRLAYHRPNWVQRRA